MNCAAAICADKLILFSSEAGITNTKGDLIRQLSLGDIEQLPLANAEQGALFAHCQTGVPGRCTPLPNYQLPG